ncbi:MAG: glycosyltransferase family 4 protein [Prochloraceae cyanobacterium]|nr:glycosyltransferase family 4 protein [Prochloraceae cyanobacterium]
MQVLHINYSDMSGGAAIASYRLHQGLIKQGINSKMLVELRKSTSKQIAKIKRRNSIENFISKVFSRLGVNYINLLSTFNLDRHPFYQEADILTFHNLHGAYFNYLAIPKLNREKPAIFRLADMWAFTGHCVYSYDCDRWKTGCGKCPYLDNYPSISRDNTHLEWKLKNWVYDRSNLTIVTPSKWLAEEAKQSMLNRFSIHHVPNGIDTEVYQPLDPILCRQVLNISPEKKVLMFVAHNLNDRRKGRDLLKTALTNLPDTLKQDLLLLTIGNGGETIAETVGIKTLNLGYVSGDRLKVIAYSASDLFVFPTRADNLPLVLQESMACGRPMVSFNVGGVSDLVRHGTTGYLAKLEDAEDFSQAILQLLEDDRLRETMSQNCRQIAIEEYSVELQAQRYIELYKQTLGRFRG